MAICPTDLPSLESSDTIKTSPFFILEMSSSIFRAVGDFRVLALASIQWSTLSLLALAYSKIARRWFSVF
jgi:hypothetical protein